MTLRDQFIKETELSKAQGTKKLKSLSLNKEMQSAMLIDFLCPRNLFGRKCREQSKLYLSSIKENKLLMIE